MKVTDFLSDLAGSLEKHAPHVDLERWKSHPAYRTHVMKGNAIKGAEPSQDVGVLQTTMSSLGYEWGSGREMSEADGVTSRRIYGWEWQKIDLVAATSPGPWGECVWQGRYRIDLALELENNFAEFSLHMRGLLDFNASLSVGVFFTSEEKLDDAKVGTGLEHQRLEEWRPPWQAPDWGAYGAEAKPIVAVFLSQSEPRIVGARKWSPTGPIVEDLWPSLVK